MLLDNINVFPDSTLCVHSNDNLSYVIFKFS